MQSGPNKAPFVREAQVNFHPSARHQTNIKAELNSYLWAYHVNCLWSHAMDVISDLSMDEFGKPGAVLIHVWVLVNKRIR